MSRDEVQKAVADVLDVARMRADRDAGYATIEAILRHALAASPDDGSGSQVCHHDGIEDASDCPRAGS